MANYDWHDRSTETWKARFPRRIEGEAEDLRGWATWDVQPASASEEGIGEEPDEHARPDEADSWLRRLRDEEDCEGERACPRLFISHRQVDEPYARRIAWLANRCGFEYWLDVLDPGLAAVAAGPLPTHKLAIRIASIIEMALLNCTHVLAVITPRTRGSMWLPYEYGRVKDKKPASIRSACWHHPAFLRSDLAEYLLLGRITRQESDIRAWLNKEKKTWYGCDPMQWNTPVPAELPKEDLLPAAAE